jgi:uncharacterized protein (TIGR02452 family)
MTTAVLHQPQLPTSAFFDLTKQHPRITAVTSVAFAALGIIGLAFTLTLSVSIKLGLILACSTTLLIISVALAPFAIQQVRASKNPPQNVNGPPPNIAPNDFAAQNAYLVQVMSDTLTHLNSGVYTSPNRSRHALSLSRAAAESDLFFSPNNSGPRLGNDTCLLSVKNKDCLYVAAELHAKGLKPIVLDMANDTYAGGGYLRGSRSQEEDCFRRSGLALAIDPQHRVQTRNFYPLNTPSRSASLYVPHVPIFRAGYDKGYQYLDHPFTVAFGVTAALSSPSLDNPLETGRARLRDAEAEITKQRVRTFFEMAHQKGHNSVVFGALGCGAFRNPPEHIAEIAMNVIRSEFPRCFKEIVFAIIEDSNSGPNGNFAPFARETFARGGKVFNAEGREIPNASHLPARIYR